MFGITPYRNVFSPFRELERMEKELFSGGSRPSAFRTDVRDIGHAFLIEAELPGFKKEDIQVDVESDTLTIHAERKNETNKEDEKGHLIHAERFYGSYERSFRFDAVESDGIYATYTDGVLSLTLPKKKETPSATRRLEIV